MFGCDHKWEIITNTYDKSPLERMKEGISSMKNVTLPSDAMYGTRIIILQCEICGKLDKTIEKV